MGDAIEHAYACTIARVHVHLRARVRVCMHRAYVGAHACVLACMRACVRALRAGDLVVVLEADLCLLVHMLLYQRLDMPIRLLELVKRRLLRTASILFQRVSLHTCLYMCLHACLYTCQWQVSIHVWACIPIYILYLNLCTYMSVNIFVPSAHIHTHTRL